MSALGDLCIAAGLPVLQADEVRVMFTRELTAAEDEIYLDILDPNRPTRRSEAQAAILQFKDEYEVAKARLLQIENATNPTNAQVIQAIRDMAKYERLLAKLIAKLILG